jgi:hypothetical protein
MESWSSVEFNALFDTQFLHNYGLYVDYKHLDSTPDNTFNFDGNLRSIEMIREKRILEDLIEKRKKYVVCKQFWASYNFERIIENVYLYVKPCPKIMRKYCEIMNKTLENQEYNFLHYRYESDFINHFNIKVKPLPIIYSAIEFKDKTKKTYIATTNILSLLSPKDNMYVNILHKDERDLIHFNFEECAFIDYMIGLNSKEVYGHIKSSFSHMLNNMKATNNYYS